MGILPEVTVKVFHCSFSFFVFWFFLGGAASDYNLCLRLKEGVIVYICDSRGVRDIYDADGSKAVAPAEPLAVLVIFV